MDVNPETARPRLSAASGCLLVFGLAFFLISAASIGFVLRDLQGPIPALVLALIIPSLFALIGLGVMGMAWRMRTSELEERQRKERHPDEPWRWRQDWEQGFAEETGRGRSRLLLAALPGTLGGRLQARLETPARVEFTITCMSQPIGGRSPSPTLLWQEHYRSETGALDAEIPFDLPPAGVDGPKRILWTVRVVDLDRRTRRTFNVPVFRTPHSDASRTKERLEAEAAARLVGFTPEPLHITRIPGPTAVEYRIHSSRRSAAWLMALFAAFFLAIGYFVGGLAYLFGGALGALFLWATLWIAFGRITLWTTPGQLTLRSSCLGIARTRTISTDRIQGFDLEPSMQKGSEVWYRIRIRLTPTGSTTCGTTLEKPEAEWLLAQIRREIHR